jgi:exosortase
MTVVDRSSMKLPWRPIHYLMLTAFTAFAIVAAWPVWSDIAQIAVRDEESSHVWLVPIVVGWIAWARRERLRTCCTAGRSLGAIFAVLGATAYLVGYSSGWQSIWHGGAVLLLVAAIVTALGRDIFFSLFPAFFALAFIIPTPAIVRRVIAVPLQQYTATAARIVCELFGMSIEQHGNMLSIGGIDVTVAEACNGMRMVFTLAYVTYAFVFITPLRGWVRAMLLLATPLIAIAANVLRLAPTLYVFEKYPSETAQRFHDLAGWVMLFIAFMILQGIVSLMRWITLPITPFRLAQS